MACSGVGSLGSGLIQGVGYPEVKKVRATVRSGIDPVLHPISVRSRQPLGGPARAIGSGKCAGGCAQGQGRALVGLPSHHARAGPSWACGRGSGVWRGWSDGGVLAMRTNTDHGRRECTHCSERQRARAKGTALVPRSVQASPTGVNDYVLLSPAQHNYEPTSSRVGPT